MTTILIKKKDTAGAPAAGDLTNAAGGAEIAVNTSTKRIYSKDSGGTIIEMGTFPSSMAVQGALSATGNVTLGDASADSVTVNGTITSNLIFTDNTYDIGASGATRPRNLFLAGDATIGGSIAATTLDLTNLEVTNIKAKDGTAGMQIADSTGVVSFTANPIMSGGTANGVAYLNGSKVLTTGSALTYNGTTFATSAIGSFTGGVGLSGVGNPSSGQSVEITFGAAGFTGVGRVMSFDRTASVRAPLAFDGSYQQWLISNSEQMRLTSAGLTVQQGAVFNESGVDSDFRVESDTNTHALFVDAGANSVAIGTSSNFGNSSILSVQADGTNGAVGFARNTDNAFAVATDYYKSRGSASAPTAVQDGDGVYQLRSVPYQGSGYTYLNSMVIEIDGGYTSGQNPPTRILFLTNTANGSATQRLGIKSTELVVNDTGNDYDFRVESDLNTHMLFVDAGSNAIGINESSPTALLQLGMTGTANINTNVQTKVTDFAAANRFGTTGLANNNDGIFFGMGVENGIPAGFGFLRENAGWNTQIRFYTNNITSGPDGTEAMQEKMRIESSAIVINETGADQDFRIESDTDANAFFLEGSSGNIGMGESSPGAPLHIDRSTTNTAHQIWQQARTRSSGNYTGLEFRDSSNETNANIVVQQQSSGNNAAQMEFYVNAGTGGVGLRNGRQVLTLYPTVTVLNEDSNDVDFRVESDSTTHALFVDASQSKVTVNKDATTNDGVFSVYGATAAPFTNQTSSQSYRMYGKLVNTYPSGGSFTLGTLQSGGNLHYFIKVTARQVDAVSSGMVESVAYASVRWASGVFVNATVSQDFTAVVAFGGGSNMWSLSLVSSGADYVMTVSNNATTYRGTTFDVEITTRDSGVVYWNPNTESNG